MTQRYDKNFNAKCKYLKQNSIIIMRNDNLNILSSNDGIRNEVTVHDNVHTNVNFSKFVSSPLVRTRPQPDHISNLNSVDEEYKLDNLNSAPILTWKQSSHLNQVSEKPYSHIQYDTVGTTLFPSNSASLLNLSNSLSRSGSINVTGITPYSRYGKYGSALVQDTSLQGKFPDIKQHRDSAGLYESSSPTQKCRLKWILTVPVCLDSKMHYLYTPNLQLALKIDSNAYGHDCYIKPSGSCNFKVVTHDELKNICRNQKLEQLLAPECNWDENGIKKVEEKLPYLRYQPYFEIKQIKDSCGLYDSPNENSCNENNIKLMGHSIYTGNLLSTNIDKPLRIGLVLSGGPAPGGHNVISGVYDHITTYHEESRLYGFIGGLDGLFNENYKVVKDELMDKYRNLGGFDMLWSGRGRIQNDGDLECAWMLCKKLDLHGLIIIGGDGSNSNTALLANYFEKRNMEERKNNSSYYCSVVGVPKTIDGDLKSQVVEISFGFDTAAKTYSELIGNLCVDVCTVQKTYHFVRIMGRSASHLMLECALQCHPNYCILGEEVFKMKKSLKEIVIDIVNMIIERRKRGKCYGIVLLPEGLIEFIPEVSNLIEKLNIAYKDNILNEELLGTEAIKLWHFLPPIIQGQLLMDREATGYIQVAKIATERLLILLVERELRETNLINLVDMPDFRAHYFGYEGRCAMPSNFDAKYCYSLGHTASIIVQNRCNGYLATVRNLKEDTKYWICAAVPLAHLMEIKYANTNKQFPAMRRSLVEISMNNALYKLIAQVRDKWLLGDFYSVPGPIQFIGPTADNCCYSVKPPNVHVLLGCKNESENAISYAEKCIDEQYQDYKSQMLKIEEYQKSHNIDNVFKFLLQYRCNISINDSCYSSVQMDRIESLCNYPSVCNSICARARPSKQYHVHDVYAQKQIISHFPNLSRVTQFYIHEVIEDKYTPPVKPGLRIGVVFLTRQSPGVANVVCGIHQRIQKVKGTCYAFYGLDGLILSGLDDKNDNNNENETIVRGKYIILKEQSLKLFMNLGGLEIIGRNATQSVKSRKIQKLILDACKLLRLDGLIIPGSAAATNDAALLSEYFLQKKCRTSIISIPCTGSNNMCNDELIEACVGFDSSTKVYASLIGNVLTDAASMPKYWHFIRLMGRQPSLEVLECALQCHPNMVIIAEEYGAANKTLMDVVHDIADIVCLRSNYGKNFGTVLIPDSLLLHLPTMRILLQELQKILKNFAEIKLLEFCQDTLINIDVIEDNKTICEISSKALQSESELEFVNNDIRNLNLIKSLYAKNCDDLKNDFSNKLKVISMLTPWSKALFAAFPRFIRQQLVHMDMGELHFEHIETEQLIAQMVKEELDSRAKIGSYTGKFLSVTHFFGYQGRSSIPSKLDADLALSYGMLACILVESGLTGYCCSIRGLCGSSKEWYLSAVPLVALMKLVPSKTASVSGMIPSLGYIDVNTPSISKEKGKLMDCANDTCIDNKDAKDKYELLNNQKMIRNSNVNFSQNNLENNSSDFTDVAKKYILQSVVPVIPTSEVSLSSRAYISMKSVFEQWALQDKYCNPGPIQFCGPSSHYVNRLTFEQNGEYFNMLRRVECYADALKETCRFGVSEDLLKQSYISLNNLLILAYYPYNIMDKVPEIINVDSYSKRYKQEGKRPAPFSSQFNEIDSKNIEKHFVLDGIYENYGHEK